MKSLKSLSFQTARKSESGFIILIVPILLVLFGFFVSAMINETKPNQFYFEATTQKSMESTQKALAAYAHRNYRVPCPANTALLPTDPQYGVENFAGAGGGCDNVKGTLPFKTLGLPESAARDEWGHLLTYKVSPGFAGIVQASDFVQVGDIADEALLVAGSNSEAYVHQMCQKSTWKDTSMSYVKTDGSPFAVTDNYNKNIYKARFCCASNVSGGGGGAAEITTTIKAFDAAPEAVAAGFGVKSIELIDGIDLGVEVLGDTSAIYGSTVSDYFQRLSDASYTNDDTHRRHIDFEYHEPDPSNPGDGHIGAMRWGGYLDMAPTFNIDITKHDVKEAEFNYQDVGSNNWDDVVPISMVVCDPSKPCDTTDLTDDTKFFDIIEYAIQLPSQALLPVAAQNGKVDVMISIKDILRDPSDPKLFNKNHMVRNNNYGDWDGDGDNEYQLYEIKFSDGHVLFDLNKTEFIDKLVSAGLIANADRTDQVKLEAAADMLQIAKIKINPLSTSMAFGGVTFSNPGAPGAAAVANTDDIRVFNGAGIPRLAIRGGDLSYGDASDGLHTGAIDQNYEAVAYALISHGIDGEGAYLTGGGQINNIPNVDENILEVQNAFDPKIVNDVRKIVSDDLAQKFDDIVMWDSQITLYNSIRSGTCESAQSL